MIMEDKDIAEFYKKISKDIDKFRTAYGVLENK